MCLVRYEGISVFILGFEQQILIAAFLLDGIRRLLARIRQGQASSRQADGLDCPGRPGCRNRPLELVIRMVFRCFLALRCSSNCTS